MPRLYGAKKDFGLRSEAGVSLPGVHEGGSSVASPSESTSSYRSTMPAYDAQRRGAHGGLNISGGKSGPSHQSSAAVSGGERSEPSAQAEEKRSKVRFGKGRKSKKGRQLESVIDESAESQSVARPSPILQVRGKDQFGRALPGLEAPEDDEVIMKLSYDAPQDITKSVTELVRLTLRPAGGGGGSSKASETLQVTLRRRGQGFGLHLSTGLAPITVTYVEPGGDAESAGVKVGDVVLEVNGEQCVNSDPARIVALKSMIQQTHVSGDLGAEEKSSGNGINDTTWGKIQARLHQDEAELKTQLKPPQLTLIDGESEKEEEKLSDKARHVAQGEKVQISESEWERMRGQRKLVFDKNTPSAIIQQQAKKSGASSATNSLSPSSKSPNLSTEVRQNKEGGTLSSPDKHGTPEKVKPSSGGGGWFKKKKKREAKGGMGEGEVPGVKQKSASLPRSFTGAVVSEGRSRPKAGGVMKVTSIDDVEYGGETENANSQSSESIKKTFNYEGALLPQSHDGHVTSSSIPRSRSHNAMFRASLMQAVQQQNHSRTPSGDATLSPPPVSHHRSKSFKVGEEGEGEELERGSGDGEEVRMGVEARNTSRSQTDVSGLRVGGETAGKVEIEPNLRLKKSGVVKGTSSWGQRPTLEVFGATDGLRKEKERKVKGDDSTDGPQAVDEPTTPELQDNKPVDLGIIPLTQPSLGQAAGHSRRDLVARSSVKRRRPSNKSSLLLEVDESQLMGRKKVELSELSPTHRPRTHTMPEKVSRKLIEAAPVFTSLHFPQSHTQDQETAGKQSSAKPPGTPAIPQQDNTGSGSTGGSERESILQSQDSNSSTASSSADMVARAVATRKSTSSVAVEEEEEEGERGLKRGAEGGGASHAGSAILARLRAEKEKEKEKEEQETLKTDPELCSRRRNKMVEKPVKSLGIASEPEETVASSDSPPPQQLPKVTLRKRPSSEPRPSSASSSFSSVPSWVAMAEKKKQRVSALLNKRDSSADPQSPPGDEAPPSLSPTSPSTAPPSVATPSPDSKKPSSPPVTKPTVSAKTTAKPSTSSQSLSPTKLTSFTSPIPKLTPITKPTPTKHSQATPTKPSQTTPTKHSKATPTKPSQATPTKPSQTTPTKPSQATPTKPSQATPTKQTQATPTKPSQATPTKPSQATPTKPSQATPTKPSQATPTKHFQATPTKPSQATPTTNEREPEEGGRPRKGTVRDRMALFQK